MLFKLIESLFTKEERVVNNNFEVKNAEHEIYKNKEIERILGQLFQLFTVEVKNTNRFNKTIIWTYNEKNYFIDIYFFNHHQLNLLGKVSLTYQLIDGEIYSFEEVSEVNYSDFTSFENSLINIIKFVVEKGDYITQQENEEIILDKKIKQQRMEKEQQLSWAKIENDCLSIHLDDLDEEMINFLNQKYNNYKPSTKKFRKKTVKEIKGLNKKRGKRVF